MSKQLDEAVVRLKKNFLNQVKNRSDIYCGVEYEFHPNELHGMSQYHHNTYPDSESDIYTIIQLINDGEKLYLSDDPYDYMEGESDRITDMDELIDHLSDNDLIDIDTAYMPESINVFNTYVRLYDAGYLDATSDEEENRILRNVFEGMEQNDYLDRDLHEGALLAFYTHLDNNGIDITDGIEYNVMLDATLHNLFEAIRDEDSHYINRHKQNIKTPITMVAGFSELEQLESYSTVVDLSNFDRELLSLVLPYSRLRNELYYDFDIGEFDPRDVIGHNANKLQVYMADTIREVQAALENDDIDFREVTEDNNNQIEVISNTMTFGKGIAHISEMFNYITDNGFTSEFSGMHVSISSDKWKDGDFNILKFFVFMDIPEVISIFPSRKHVADLYELFMNNSDINRTIKTELENNKSLTQAISKIQQYLSKNINKIMTGKFQSIKFDDYSTLNGRIELRYFGGEDYEERYEEIEQKMLEAVYIMELSYGDLYNKEYQKGILGLLNNFANGIVKHYIRNGNIDKVDITPEIRNINTLEQLHKLVHSDIFV